MLMVNRRPRRGSLLEKAQKDFINLEVTGARWFLLAANNGGSDAMIVTGLLYLQALYVGDKLNTIIPALEKFADSDVTDAESINNSVLYLFGNKIFELSMAHVKPEIMSILNLKGYRLVSPVRYIKQECDPRMPNSKELRQVRFWNLLTNKKSSGVSTAQLILSSIYFENVLLKDIDKALYRAKKAAKNNHEEDLLLLSLFYSDGRGIEPGYKETKKCFEKAYNSGRAPSASFHLGVLYYNGNGFERNCSTALRLFKEYIMNESNDDHGSAYLFISA